MPTAAETFAESLRYWMGERKMTQAALAQKSGIGQTTISLYLRPRGLSSRPIPQKQGGCADDKQNSA